MVQIVNTNATLKISITADRVNFSAFKIILYIEFDYNKINFEI